MKHPLQVIVRAVDGTVRFQGNALVQQLSPRILVAPKLCAWPVHPPTAAIGSNWSSCSVIPSLGLGIFPTFRARPSKLQMLSPQPLHRKNMNIRASAAGQMQFDRPQQEWRASRSGDPSLMQIANFAGHELVAITDDKGGFELEYLGFTEGPYPTIDHAKAGAPKFALAVLDVMKSKIIS